MLRKFIHTIVIPGTLSAGAQYVATIPTPCTIQHVSMVQSNADGDGRIRIGNSGDNDCYLVYTPMGVSGTPVELKIPADFRYDVYPHLAAGEIFKIYIDHDGAGGTAAQDVTIVITFTEG